MDDKITKKLKDRIKELEKEVRILRRMTLNVKEYYVTEIAKIFGEKAKEVKTMKHTGKEKYHYGVYTDFYDRLQRNPKDWVIALLEKLKKVGTNQV